MKKKEILIATLALNLVHLHSFGCATGTQDIDDSDGDQIDLKADGQGQDFTQCSVDGMLSHADGVVAPFPEPGASPFSLRRSRINLTGSRFTFKDVLPGDSFTVYRDLGGGRGHSYDHTRDDLQSFVVESVDSARFPMQIVTRGGELTIQIEAGTQRRIGNSTIATTSKATFTLSGRRTWADGEFRPLGNQLGWSCTTYARAR
jgi:hypothetical protein